MDEQVKALINASVGQVLHQFSESTLSLFRAQFNDPKTEQADVVLVLARRSALPALLKTLDEVDALLNAEANKPAEVESSQ